MLDQTRRLTWLLFFGQSLSSAASIAGSTVGAIAGANGQQVQPNGNEIRIPAGSMLNFQLRQPLRVVNWSDPGYRNGENHYHRDNDWYR